VKLSMEVFCNASTLPRHESIALALVTPHTLQTGLGNV
jgi:hypothetical protein